MLKAVSCDTLEQVSDLVGEYGVIGIDEGQFFPDVRGVLLTCVVGDPIPHTFSSLQLLVFVNRMANLGKTVVIAALDGTFEASVRQRLARFVRRHADSMLLAPTFTAVR